MNVKWEREKGRERKNVYTNVNNRLCHNSIYLRTATYIIHGVRSCLDVLRNYKSQVYCDVQNSSFLTALTISFLFQKYKSKIQIPLFKNLSYSQREFWIFTYFCFYMTINYRFVQKILRKAKNKWNYRILLLYFFKFLLFLRPECIHLFYFEL